MFAILSVYKQSIHFRIERRICLTSRLLFRHLLKRVRVGDVIDEDGSVGVAVVDGPEGVEPLLARRVPYREVAPRPADVDLLVQEGRLKGGSSSERRLERNLVAVHNFLTVLKFEWTYYKK